MFYLMLDCMTEIGAKDIKAVEQDIRFDFHFADLKFVFLDSFVILYIVLIS